MYTRFCVKKMEDVLLSMWTKWSYFYFFYFLYSLENFRTKKMWDIR